MPKMSTVAGLMICLAAPVQAAEAATGKLFGTFTGEVTSGEETLSPLFAPPTTTNLTGQMFTLRAAIDSQDPDGFDDFFMNVAAPGTQSAGGVRDSFASFEAFYSAGILRLVISGGGFGNDSGAARLFADRIGGQFVNWRGSVDMGGQAGGAADWQMAATMDRLIFSGTYAGPVPEPAAWAMMIAGLGFVGAAARRAPKKRGLLTRI